VKEILSLSGVAQARLIRERAVSSEELVRAHIEQIEAINPQLNAVVEVLGESALEAARAADRRAEPLSPLDGVPFSIKDSIEVAGTVCTAGTLGYRNRPRSAADATLVARLRAAGAISLARTNLPDLLFSFESDNLIHGRTNNPHDLTRTSGGSSGGEAALIAAGGSPFGLGSDAAGSVRVPAHFCGIASLKPTSGRLPRTGHVPPPGGWVEAVWQIGPMARHVEDLQALMPILLGPDGLDYTVVPMPYRDPAETRVEDSRIAYFIDNGILPPDPETEATVRRAAGILHAREDRPPGIDRSYDLEMRYLGPDGGEGVREFLRGVGSHRTHPLLEGWLAKYRVGSLAECWAELDEFRAGMYRFLQSYDAILSPVAAFPALPHGHSIREDIFPGFSYTMTYNLTGWPAAVVPFGKTATGLPIGVQIAAAPWREDVVLAIARRLEVFRLEA
jgi:amidase